MIAIEGPSGARDRLAYPGPQALRARTRNYCFDAVQRPLHPSDRTKEPEPDVPENRPVLVQLTPEADPPLRVEPLALT